jgi:hypothetical protein
MATHVSSLCVKDMLTAANSISIINLFMSANIGPLIFLIEMITPIFHDQRNQCNQNKSAVKISGPAVYIGIAIAI